jgi:glycosyltransferase involved in cell wall biosynthesis
VSEPRFSAVIPAHNAVATLDSAVRSVLSQTVDDFEVIIVDDGSSDDTLARARALEADPRVRVVSQPNQGPAGARRTGVAHSRGVYVGFLDSDDLWMPRYLEVLGGALDADPGAGLAYTDGWTLDDQTRRIRRATTMARQQPGKGLPAEADEFLRVYIKANFIPAETLARRAALDDVGSFNPALAAAEEYELWLRMLANGWRAVRPPGLLMVRRQRADSRSSDPRLMVSALKEVMRLVAEEHPAPDDVKATARTQMHYWDEKLAMLRHERPLRNARRTVRLRLGRVYRRLQRDRLWYTEPPAEVAEAFPDLRAV